MEEGKLKSSAWIAITVLGLSLTGSLLASRHYSSEEYKDFTKTQFRSQNSNRNFDLMMDVLTHRRCVNCHPNDNVPKQGEDSHAHHFGVTGGDSYTGEPATRCAACHQSENNNYSGVPGAPGWNLAPESMKWEGLSRKEIAESMLDPMRNGGRTHKELLHHHLTPSSLT
jgi:hypothetical protein